MSQSINDFIELVAKRNANEPEFMQAVKEVAETVIPFIEQNKKYQNKMLLERMVEPERVIMFRVTWIDDAGATQVNRGYRIQNEFSHRAIQRWNSFPPYGKLKHLEILGVRTNV